jgi:hypothetical protein
MSSPKHTQTKTALPLLARKKLFSTEISLRCPHYLQLLALPSLSSKKQSAIVIRMYVIELRIRFSLSLPLSLSLSL